ncbi:LOW QUALITY PROTEIN: Mitochondrial substrate/solute carrier [Dillenia turbinata]|uniref:Mitochondrial substrate/solute carrier n=1 Tax=Dillenia turbinata TaxID=194707 RepID=A0AAN8YVJ8_9MAGN
MVSLLPSDRQLRLRNVFFVDSTQSLSLSSKAFLGGFSGLIAQYMFHFDLRPETIRLFAGYNLELMIQVVASPADHVKVRMQADGLLVRQGLQPRYSGIIKAEGIVGLWRGVFQNIQWTILVNRENWLAMIMQNILLSELKYVMITSVPAPYLL